MVTVKSEFPVRGDRMLAKKADKSYARHSGPQRYVRLVALK